MARTTIDTWDLHFLERSPSFDSISEVCLPFTKVNKWPTLEQFSTEFKIRKIQSHSNIQIHSVEQGGAPEKFNDQYESRIYLKGELQTRLENWHDYFNAMCWLQFPKIKSTLNTLHFKSSKTRQEGTNRRPLENAITLFDECGAVIVADDESLLDLIVDHKWKELFWHNKEAFGKNIQCYVVGHALHEKSLTPYIGMTAHTILLKQTSDFFKKTYSVQVKKIDQMISDAWLNKLPMTRIDTPKDLQPFPLLGVPGWWNHKQDEIFYLNDKYFRGKSRVKK